MIAPARIAAYRALSAIHAGSDLPAALAATREPLTDARDHALALDIVTGSLRWQRALDHLVSQVSRRPVETLDDPILVIVRLSLYQLLHLDRVPAAAVVDDAFDVRHQK